MTVRRSDSDGTEESDLEFEVDGEREEIRVEVIVVE